MKRQITAIIIMLAFIFLFIGCNSKLDIKSIDFSEEEIQKLSTLIPSQTIYQLYEVEFNTNDYSKLELICDIYSFGELLESRSVGKFTKNEELDNSKNKIYIGIVKSTYNTILISYNNGGVTSQTTVDLSDFKELNIESLGNTSTSTITKSSENEYLLFLSIYNDAEQSIAFTNNLDDCSDYPFYYAVRCILRE